MDKNMNYQGQKLNLFGWILDKAVEDCKEDGGDVYNLFENFLADIKNSRDNYKEVYEEQQHSTESAIEGMAYLYMLDAMEQAVIDYAEIALNPFNDQIAAFGLFLTIGRRNQVTMKLGEYHSSMTEAAQREAGQGEWQLRSCDAEPCVASYNKTVHLAKTKSN